MLISREQEDTRGLRLFGFRRGVGFQPTSVEIDQSMEMMLEYDDEDDDPEDLDDEDLDAENTWPSRRPTRA